SFAGMGYRSGFLHRPLTAVAAVAVTFVSVDVGNVPPHQKSSNSSSSTAPSNASASNSANQVGSWVSQLSILDLTNLSFVPKIPVSIPNLSLPCTPNYQFNSLSASFTTPILLSLYQSANLAKPARKVEFTSPKPLPHSDFLYRWHSPDRVANGVSENPDCSSEKNRTVVVLLGWLGAKQRHLKRYADWFTTD
ncbi:hypothetical protein ACLOJK_006640, partial [Asimina triloba]